jgi:hypothetical protein
MHGSLAADVIPIETRSFPFERAQAWPFNPTVVYPGGPHAYGVPVRRQLPDGRWGGVTWEEINPQLHTDQAFLFGYGKIFYRDIFGHTLHVVTFCELLVGGFMPTKIGAPVSGFDLRKQCSDYNNAYDEP